MCSSLSCLEIGSYLEFISPDDPESHLWNALNKGGGVHHICYAAADIDAAIAELRRKGMSLPPGSCRRGGISRTPGRVADG